MLIVGWDNVADVASCYVLDWIPVGARFCATIQNGPGIHLAYCAMGTRSFLGVNPPGHGINHPPYLAPRLNH